MRFKAEALPDGWELRLLDSVTKRGSGHTPNKHYSAYWNGGIKWVSLSDSNDLDNGYIYKTDKEISEKGLKNSSAVLHPKGTVVLSRDAGVGKSAVLAEEMAVSQHFIAWQCNGKNQVHNWFLYYWLQYMKKEFERIAVGSTIKTIGLPYFKKLKTPYPPYEEQTKIANILSTWDKAIETVEQLIKNSRAQKKALMQQLLTGKKRLPGFNNVWKGFTLSDLGKTFNGLSGKTKDDFGKGKPFIPYVNIFNNDRINTNKFEFVLINPNETQSKIIYGDIFFTTSSETPEEVGLSSVLLDEVEDLYLNSFCFGFRLKDFHTLLPNYARYLLRSSAVRREIIKLAQGSTRFNLSKAELMKITLKLPPIEEQKKIVYILDNTTHQLSKYTNQLTCLKNEKKALMQQLLTGKRRVKVDPIKERSHGF